MKSIGKLFTSRLQVVNLGLESFADSIRIQGVPVQHVDWRPPAGGDPRIIQLLDSLSVPSIQKQVEDANHEAVNRIIDAQPVLVDVRQARDVIPGMHRKLILHAGPPVACEVGVIADGAACPDYGAADLLSQAEHNPGSAVLLTPDEGLARDVE